MCFYYVKLSTVQKSLQSEQIQRYSVVYEIIRFQEDQFLLHMFFAASTYNVRISGERPTIAAKENATPQSNSFFTCPKNQP